MNIKEFVKITKAKIFLFLIVFAASSIPRRANVVDAVITYTGFPFPYITAVTGAKLNQLPVTNYAFSLLGLAIDVLVLYIVVAIIVSLIRKMK